MTGFLFGTSQNTFWVIFQNSFCQIEEMLLLLYNTYNAKRKPKNILVYTAKLVPQPQVLLALGLLKVKPLEFNPPCQSTSIPIK